MLPNSVREALLRLNEAGFEAWLVGGCVRDRLMGAEPHDYDITTSASLSAAVKVTLPSLSTLSS